MSLVWSFAHWGWPQWTIAGVYVFVIVSAAITDGKPRTGNGSFAMSLVAVAAGVFILTSGGFFA